MTFILTPKRDVTKNGKEYVKRAKIQRLITPYILRGKRLLKKFFLKEKAIKDKKAYQYLM